MFFSAMLRWAWNTRHFFVSKAECVEFLQQGHFIVSEVQFFVACVPEHFPQVEFKFVHFLAVCPNLKHLKQRVSGVNFAALIRHHPYPRGPAFRIFQKPPGGNLYTKLTVSPLFFFPIVNKNLASDNSSPESSFCSARASKNSFGSVSAGTFLNIKHGFLRDGVVILKFVNLFLISASMFFLETSLAASMARPPFLKCLIFLIFILDLLASIAPRSSLSHSSGSVMPSDLTSKVLVRPVDTWAKELVPHDVMSAYVGWLLVWSLFMVSIPFSIRSRHPRIVSFWALEMLPLRLEISSRIIETSSMFGCGWVGVG